MEIQTLANILVASSVAHGLHSMGEPVNIIKKVKRLDAYINKQTPPKIPGGIDTRTKALGLAFGFNAILFILAFLLSGPLISFLYKHQLWRKEVRQKAIDG
mgnify:CR=1 FL=1